METNRGLVNVFTGQKATTLQSEDLLHFREVGERDYLNFIRSRILRESDTAQESTDYKQWSWQKNSVKQGQGIEAGNQVFEEEVGLVQRNRWTLRSWSRTLSPPKSSLWLHWVTQ